MEGRDTVGGGWQMNAPIFDSETMIVVYGWLCIETVTAPLLKSHQNTL